MSLLVENTPSGCRLRIDGEMTVACAANLRDEILAALSSRDGAEIEVDLSGVSEIDSAGLQLMLQLKLTRMSAEEFDAYVLHVVETFIPRE